MHTFDTPPSASTVNDRLPAVRRPLPTAPYRILIILFLLAVPLCGAPAQSADPILRLHSEMHNAAVRTVSTDGEKYLLTASEDKTARLWDVKTGNSLRVFRPPVGQGIEGELYACALSADGTVAAVGGCTGGTWNSNDSVPVTKGNWQGYARKTEYSVYLFATTTGGMIRNIDGMDAAVADLKFSPDGRFLAIALEGNRGIRVVHANSGAAFRQLTGFGGTARRMAYAPSGQLAVVADDGYIRLYSKSYGLVKAQPLKGKPSDVAFSPDGKELLVGFSDAARISVIDAVTLQPKDSPKIPFALMKTAFPAVAYGRDGTIYAGGDRILYWKGQTSGSIPVGKGKITDLETADDGSVLYGTSYPETGRVLGHKPPAEWTADDRNGSYRRTGATVEFDRLRYRRFQLNDDGSRVGIVSVGNNMLYFSLADRELTEAPASLPEAVDRMLQEGIRVSGWQNGVFRLSNREMDVFEPGEKSNCIDVAASGSRIVAGTGQHIYCLDRNGEILWKQPLTNECVAIKMSGNEKVLAAAFSNGTVGWFDMRAGIRTLTLFPHPDNKRWVLWTPSGYYDCAAGAEELIGWHLNRGKDREAGFYPIAQFRSTFFRPDIIDITLAVSQKTKQPAKDSRQESAPETGMLAQTLPPEVSILAPQPESSISGKTLAVSYNISGKEEKQWVKILVDGRPVQLLPDVRQGQNHVTVEVPGRDCEVSVIAANRFGAGVPASVRLKWAGNKMEDSLKPNLYILAIGVSNYADNSLRLQFAAKDAADFAHCMKQQSGLLYRNVEVKLLTDGQSTKAGILDGLDWLQRETTSRDVAMLFLAGHGVNDNAGTYFYLPVDADTERLRTTSVNYMDIKQTISAIPGKIIMFMDACHSGNIMGERRSALYDIDGMVNELASAENGAIVFTSSTGRQYSLENAAWNNGAFTKALVDGINGKADLFNQKRITIKTLDAYITQRVKELTGGKQSPTTIIPASIPDFPIVVVR